MRRIIISSVFISLAVTPYAFGQCVTGNCYDGRGTYIWSSGHQYTGFWREGLMHGQGDFLWSNGDTYNGKFSEGKMNGQGTYTWKEQGDKYTGEMEENQMNGFGKYFWGKTGAVYEGYFENDHILNPETGATEETVVPE